MKINFEFREGKVTNGVTIYANDVYVGELILIPQDKLLNWCAIQNQFKCKFALRNESTFAEVLNAIKEYIVENSYGGLVISSYTSGGIRSFYSDEIWTKYGFKQDDNLPPTLMVWKNM